MLYACIFYKKWSDINHIMPQLTAEQFLEGHPYHNAVLKKKMQFAEPTHLDKLFETQGALLYN